MKFVKPVILAIAATFTLASCGSKNSGSDDRKPEAKKENAKSEENAKSKNSSEGESSGNLNAGFLDTWKLETTKEVSGVGTVRLFHTFTFEKDQVVQNTLCERLQDGAVTREARASTTVGIFVKAYNKFEVKDDGLKTVEFFGTFKCAAHMPVGLYTLNLDGSNLNVDIDGQSYTFTR